MQLFYGPINKLGVRLLLVNYDKLITQKNNVLKKLTYLIAVYTPDNTERLLRLTTTNMEESDESILFGLMEEVSFKICKFCTKEFAYHRSTSSLRYHLNAKHVAASTETAGAVSASSPGPSASKRCW